MPQPVIVVGASLVGLSAALNLSKLRIPTIVLERHASISKHPRAMGFTPRTMEVYQSLGIADQIPQAPENFTLVRARVESLVGKRYETSEWADTDQKSNKKQQQPTEPKQMYSPFRGAAIPQDRLETILETAARQEGADSRRQHRLLAVDQDENGVTATVLDAQGRTIQLQGSYLIAADGNRSMVRESLGISRHGRGHMQTLRSVMFHASLDEYLQGVHQFNIEQPDLKAFMTSYNDGRWVLMFYDDIERDEATLISAIRQAIGKPDVPVELITTGRWEMEALIADKFQSGRVFLAGDAAHTLPPNRGGYGANTGIADVHNLAWKLGAVLSGESTPDILDTYDAERRPVALLRHDQIFARKDYKFHLEDGTAAAQMIDDDAMEFGQIYRSKGFIGVDDSLPAAQKPDEWAGQPGTHVPHFPVVKDGKQVSILDLLDRESWVLLSADPAWEEVVPTVNLQSSARVRNVQLGGDITSVKEGTFEKLLGVTGSGASLIRPDGYIAWRTASIPSNPVEVLGKVLGQVAFTTSAPV